MKKETNIHSLPNANTDKAAIEAFKRFIPDYLEHMPIIAQLRMASYKAHIAEGFSEDQAIKLCVDLFIK